MPDPNTKPSPPTGTDQVLEAVSFFEQMLQTMPDDRLSLDVLSQAYEQAGDTARACSLLARLARVVEHEADAEAARLLQTRLARYAGTPEADRALEQLARFVSQAAKPAAAKTDRPAAGKSAAVPTEEVLRLIQDPANRRALAMQELDFAWMLHEEGLLSEDQYASVVSDITDLSANATPHPVSVLHLYHDRQMPQIDRILSFATAKSGAPLLPLASFDPQAAAYGLLPLDYLTIKGVLPFEVMSNDLLVATLNPLNGKLKAELERLTGRRCHFYLVLPAEFDAALEKIRKQTPAHLPSPA